MARQKSHRRWRQRSLLTLLGLFFAVSSVLRLGNIDEAWANIGTPIDSDIMTVGSCDMTDTLRATLAEAASLRDGLTERQLALDDRERALDAAQILIEARIAELEAAEARLEALLSLSDSAAETDLERLTRVYETMDAAESAPLFAQMEPSFAAGFLSRMTPEAGASLLAELEPQAAYAISVVLATRNASAPRRDAPDTQD